MGLFDGLPFDTGGYDGAQGLLARLSPAALLQLGQSQGLGPQGQFSDTNFDQNNFAPSAPAPGGTPFYGQDQNVAVGNYQMPVFGGPPQGNPMNANAQMPTDVSAQSVQPQQASAPPMAARAPQQVPPQSSGAMGALPSFLQSSPNSPGLGDRIGTAFQNFANAGGPLQAIAGGISGLVNGQRTDPVGISQQNLGYQFNAVKQVLRASGMSPDEASSKAMLAVLNPEAGKTLLGEALTNKEKWAQIGPDAMGNPRYGFVNEREQTIDGKPVGVGGGNATGQPSALGDPTLSGADYLASLPPSMQSQVKAIVEGRMQPPSGFALKSPRVQALLTAAAQYEPGFDMTKWGSRASTAKDFASGTSAKNVTSLNTVVGHLSDLADKADALGNINSGLGPANTMWNYVKNSFENASGAPEVNNFTLARNAVADEMAKVFRSSGMSDHEISAWKDTLSSSMTPDQLKGAVKTGIGLMDSRLSALNDQRDRGMSTSNEPRSLLNPHSQESLAKVERWANGGSLKDASQSGAPAAPPPPPSLKVGQSVNYQGTQIKKIAD